LSTSPGVVGRRLTGSPAFLSASACLVVVDDFDIYSSLRGPYKANPVLLIDPD